MPTVLPNAARFQYSPFLVTAILVAAHSVEDLHTPSTSEVLPVVDELAPVVALLLGRGRTDRETECFGHVRSGGRVPQG